MSNNNPIGIFDSGVGGLSVLKKEIEVLPNESIRYFADIARCPYGVQTMDTVYNYSKQICNFLIKEHDVKIIVIACNTATIASIDKLKYDFDIPIIGVPDFGAENASELTNNGKIGILATDATIKSNYYQNKLKSYNDKYEVYGQGCPNFVLDVESGDFNSPEVDKHIEEYTKDMLEKGVDTIILGCTHFPFLQDEIEKMIPKDITIVDPATRTVDFLHKYLKEHDLLHDGSEERSIKFYSSSDQNDTLIKLSSNILKAEQKVETIDIDKY